MAGDTHGKKPVEQPVLPAKLGALMASVAENLELHMKSLDLRDGNARKEHKTYAHLAREHRNISAALQAIAAEMARCRTPATGKLAEDVNRDPKILAAFGKFMTAEKDLIGLLQKRMRRDSKKMSPRRHKDRD